MLDDERFAAGLAYVWPGYTVRLAMLVKIILARETFATHLALMHFLSRVRHRVSDEMLLSAEGFRACRAYVGPLAGVQLPMLEKVLFPFKRLAADVAAEAIAVVLNCVVLAADIRHVAY